jgi:hypothetical protein
MKFLNPRHAPARCKDVCLGKAGGNLKIDVCSASQPVFLSHFKRLHEN